jgi:haloalkane dehalogenase
MTVLRTPPERFAGLREFPFEPHYLEIEASGERLRMHYVDDGVASRGTFLMVHGMPTWSYLYRRMIPPLVAAGYRCIAPDHIGFGKSDKVLEDSWYSIERHTANLGQFVDALDLRGLTLVCQDWGGPTGLHQAVAMPERFERLCILNTWLHHPGYQYSPAIRRWQSLWQPGGPMEAIQGCGLVMQNFLANFPRGAAEPLSADQAFAAYEAPFPDQAWKAGPRRFPLSIPIEDESVGNAAVQAHDFEALKRWDKPAHFIFGTKDLVFTEEWGRQWSAMLPHSTFDTVEAGHFLQETHGAEVAALLLARIDAE